jgi:hypothetical protein
LKVGAYVLKKDDAAKRGKRKFLMIVLEVDHLGVCVCQNVTTKRTAVVHKTDLVLAVDLGMTRFRPKRGRPRIADTQKNVIIRAKVPEYLAKRYREIGGAVWLRKTLEEWRAETQGMKTLESIFRS